MAKIEESLCPRLTSSPAVQRKAMIHEPATHDQRGEGVGSGPKLCSSYFVLRALAAQEMSHKREISCCRAAVRRPFM